MTKAKKEILLYELCNSKSVEEFTDQELNYLIAWANEVSQQSKLKKSK